MRINRFALLCRISKRKGANVREQFAERYGVQIRKTGLVFINDDSEDARRWRKLGKR